MYRLLLNKPEWEGGRRLSKHAKEMTVTHENNSNLQMKKGKKPLRRLNVEETQAHTSVTLARVLLVLKDRIQAPR